MNRSPLDRVLEMLPQLKAAGISRPGYYKLLVPREIPEDEGLDLATDIIRKSKDEERYTFGVVYKASHSKDDQLYLDAHREFIDADELQKALWKYVQKGNRDIYVQHGMNPGDAFKKAGEWVELTTWPEDYLLTSVQKADGSSDDTVIPKGSAYMGVLWEPWAWERVKLPAGDPLKIRGYSLGGRAKRQIVGKVPDSFRFGSR